MPQAKPGIATTILMPEPDGDAFVEISPNKTLIILPLTSDNPDSPEIIEDLQTVDAVFGHFKPSCEVELDKEDGSSIKEIFKFGGLADFDAKKLTNQSSFLKVSNIEYDAYIKIIRQLKSNKSLVNVIQNPETKSALINVFKSLVSELEEVK